MFVKSVLPIFVLPFPMFMYEIQPLVKLLHKYVWFLGPRVRTEIGQTDTYMN